MFRNKGVNRLFKKTGTITETLTKVIKFLKDIWILKLRA